MDNFYNEPAQGPVVDADAAGTEGPPETVEVPLVPLVRMTAETLASQYNGFNGQLCITSGPVLRQTPLILDKVVASNCNIYDMGPERGGKIRASLHIVSEPAGDFDVEVPLAMKPYRVPANPAKCLDMAACRAVDAENEGLQAHNRYITSLLSLFVHHNGCGTSANHVTLPPPPDAMVNTRADRLKALMNDKYGITVLAVRFLHEHNKVCEVDYNVENAVEIANEVAFQSEVEKKKKNGMIRFRICGSPPACWNGDESCWDSRGRKVQFIRGAQHSFISPEIMVAEQTEDEKKKKKEAPLVRKSPDSAEPARENK